MRGRQTVGARIRQFRESAGLSSGLGNSLNDGGHRTRVDDSEVRLEKGEQTPRGVKTLARDRKSPGDTGP